MNLGIFTGELTLHFPDYGGMVIAGTYTSLGLRMGENFIQDLTEPVTLKDYVSNESRLEDGKRVLLLPSPRVESREVTLTFTLTGKAAGNVSAEQSMWTRRKNFFDLLKSGWVGIEVPDMDTDGRTVYWLLYKGKGNTYGISLTRDFCNISLKFIEPNPAHRKASGPPYGWV